MSNSTKKNISLGKIIKIVILTIIGSYISFGIYRCSEENDVIALKMPKLNPNLYVFPMPIDSVANQIKTINFPGVELKSSDGKIYRFKRSPDSGQYSFIYVYRKSKKYIRCTYDIRATLRARGTDSTSVFVKKLNYKVQYGVAYWKTPFFNSYHYKTHSVFAKFIEECDFLRLLGKKLGCLDKMPYTNYPKELSREEIMGRYPNCPFTEEEMFGNKIDK